jgi:hypothetical protein
MGRKLSHFEAARILIIEIHILAMSLSYYLLNFLYFFTAEMAAVTAGPKRTRQTYTRYQTLELEKVRDLLYTRFHTLEKDKLRDPYQIPDSGARKGTGSIPDTILWS